MMRVIINPELLRWARERARRTVQDLVTPFPRLERWERDEERPTLKQVERFAKAVHVPVGYLFLPEPPVESVPIPDFRAAENVYSGNPTPDLLDTIYICQQRQEWYRDFARSTGEGPLVFVGSTNTGSAVASTATTIRQALSFDIEERRRMATWTDALRRFIEQADALGILVMCSGVVLNNNRRHLDPEEFRGFAMADDLAPLVFINGADTKAAQMFTLAHELAHIWIGQSAISDAQALLLPDLEVERWCNQVAAELLVPLAALRSEYDRTALLGDEVGRLARRFKVSTLVILRRIHDAGGLTTEELWEAYKQELARLCAFPRGSGGDFYLTQAARVSKRFARALVVSTLEGQNPSSRCLSIARFLEDPNLSRARTEPGGDDLMAYLLDANVFIQAKNLYYGLDFCPAFWDWLIAHNEAGQVFSIEKVGDEIMAGGDDLATWALDRATSFFLKPDAAMLPALGRVSTWATGQNYDPAAVNTFLQIADYYLVAYALAHGYTVVTHEIASTSTKKIKIPDACIGLGIKCMTPFEMLRRERARFVLSPST